MPAFDKGWMISWQKIVNTNNVLKVIGKYFDADIYMEIGELRYIVSVRKGVIEKIVDQITPESTWDFALRAPKATWEKFIEKVPPPMYNDLWAIAHPLHGNLKMEGNIKLLWQNLRALSWMLSLMREVGG
jgi:hypothetical protein